MNTHPVKRTIAAIAVSAAAVTGVGAFSTAAAAPAGQAQEPAATQVRINQDQWAQELVSTFAARYAKALKAGDTKEVVHLRNSYFMQRAELVLQEIAAMDGQDPIYKDFGLPKAESFEITKSTPSVITVKYMARTTADNKLHTWNFQVDQESALIRHVQLA